MSPLTPVTVCMASGGHSYVLPTSAAVWLQRCRGPTIFPLVIVRLQACSRIIQVEIKQTPFFALMNTWPMNVER